MTPERETGSVQKLREVDNVGQIVTKNERPQCRGSSQEQHQHDADENHRCDISDARPPVKGAEQECRGKNGNLAVPQAVLEQMLRASPEKDFLAIGDEGKPEPKVDPIEPAAWPRVAPKRGSGQCRVDRAFDPAT
jgi:hypothetical protein